MYIQQIPAHSGFRGWYAVPSTRELKEQHGEAVNGAHDATADIAVGTRAATAGCGCGVGGVSIGGSKLCCKLTLTCP
jgi:hypothetical protein